MKRKVEGVFTHGIIRFTETELENLVAGNESNLNPVVPDLEAWTQACEKISLALERINNDR